MLWEALSGARDLGRVYDIGSVLVRYGFGDLVRRVGMAAFLERVGRQLHWSHAEDIARMTPPERVRQALEALGPAFVKMGQLLSTRVDLLAPEWIAELEKLQDQAAPVPFEDIRAQLVEDLGDQPDGVFARFERDALAAGSIAQVHRGRLTDGTEVVVKVRRPGIEAVIEADLRLLARLAAIAERESPVLRRFRPVMLVRQFTRSLARELDLRSEGRNALRIAENLAGYEGIVVPRVHWSRERINVQDFVDGIAGRDLDAVERAGLDRRLLARQGAGAVLKMVLEDGFFHADPHPGNVFYLPGNRIALIDFGMVGRLTRERREQLTDLLYGLARRETERVSELLLEWGGDTSIDSEALARDVDAFIDEFHGLPLESINVGQLLAHMTSIMRDHGLVLPPDLALLLKAAISLEGLGRLLDPDFDMVAEARPILERMALERRSPRAVARRGVNSMREAVELVASLPRELRRLLKASRRGAITVRVDLTDLERASERLDRSASRLTIGIVTAALIVGSSIVMTVDTERTWFGLPFFGLLGFLGAVAGSLWLLHSIRRGGREK